MIPALINRLLSALGAITCSAGELLFHTVVSKLNAMAANCLGRNRAEPPTLKEGACRDAHLREYTSDPQ